MSEPLKPGDAVEVWSASRREWKRRGTVAEVSGTVVKVGDRWYPASCVRKDVRAQAVRNATADYLRKHSR